MLRFLTILILSVGVILESSVSEIYNGAQYIIFRDKKSWHNAYRHCNARQAELLFIETEEENNYITNLVKTTPDYRGENYWIGATELGSIGDWYWLSTGSDVVYANWAVGEPSFTANEHCVNLWNARAHQWNNANCNTPARFICKAVPCVTAPQEVAAN